MYLRNLFLENSGPLQGLTLVLPFAADDRPKPVVLVGGNGSGKTNLLSIIADSIFECAAKHYTDVLPGAAMGGRAWFRLIGPSTISAGAKGACALLQFSDTDGTYGYKEKGGFLPRGEVLSRVPDPLKQYVNWSDDGAVKEFSISDQQAQKIFEQGVHLYFPSSRSEIPHWLNKKSVSKDSFDLLSRFSKELKKPIYVEHGLDQLCQWMASIFLESRVAFDIVQSGDQASVNLDLGTLPVAIQIRPVLQALDKILQAILNDPTARLIWGGRLSAGKIAFYRSGMPIALPLDALSAGQATLLNIFGTLLRYEDGTVPGSPTPDRLTGMCLIDEIDAHMHVELQHQALPKLMQMFPRVQFIVSSHSPLFALGMEEVYGKDGMMILDMPSGTPILPEAYVEFGRALHVFQESKAFARAMMDIASKPGKLLVLLEGETDPIYMRTAVELLERTDLLGHVEFEWVGGKDVKSGDGFHTGKDALNASWNFLRANPDFVKRQILLLYDNDACKKPAQEGKVYVRCQPSRTDNTVVESGVENLLPASSITEDMFDRQEIKKKNGERVIRHSLNKMKLCKYICGVKRDVGDFLGFVSVLDMVKAVWDERGSA